MLLHHFLEQSAQRFPHKIAAIHNDGQTSYNWINSTANRIARGLRQMGIIKKDRIILISENSIDYIVSYYGIAKAGGIAVPIAPEIKADGLAPVLSQLDAKVIIASAKTESMLQSVLSKYNNVQHTIISGPQSAPSQWSCSLHDLSDLQQSNTDENLDIAINENDPASIIYTSGSMGTPKGVLLTHKNITTNTHSIVRYLNLTENDIQMVVLPFFYVMGKSLLNTHFAVGGTVVINNRFAFTAAVLNQMVEEKVTGFSGVPSTYAYLLNRSPLVRYRDKLTSLRYCTQAGGHMAAFLKKELRQALPQFTQIIIMYGATEASARLTYLDPARFEDKMGSIGKEITGVTIRILDESGHELPVNETGELVASGDNIMQGYWKDPEATARALDKNGYHTGDLGFRDSEGFLFVTGRRDAILKIGGHRINPQEVEDAIIATGFVVESIVVGIPDALLGNKLIALAVPKKKEFSETTILGACASLLPRYKLPAGIFLMTSLPKNANGKIDRSRCTEIANSPKKEHVQ